MASTNVQVVEGALAAFQRGGFSDIDQLIEWLTEDVALRSPIVGAAEGYVYHGHSGIREWARAVRDAFEELTLHADEMREVGDAVVAVGRLHARGDASGLALDVPVGWVLIVRDGLIAELGGYLDPDEAMAVARARVRAEE